MYMQTTLTNYHLPLLGRTTAATATEFGTDTRSIFVRPITAAGDVIALPGAKNLNIKAERSDYQSFDRWLMDMQAYRYAANQNNEEAVSETNESGSSTESNPATEQEASTGSTEEGSNASAGNTGNTDDGSNTGNTNTGNGNANGTGGNNSSGGGGGFWSWLTGR